MGQLIRARKECSDFGRGTWRILNAGAPANFADRARVARLGLDPGDRSLVDRFGDREYGAVGDVRHLTRRLQLPLAPRRWHASGGLAGRFFADLAVFYVVGLVC